MSLTGSQCAVATERLTTSSPDRTLLTCQREVKRHILKIIKRGAQGSLWPCLTRSSHGTFHKAHSQLQATCEISSSCFCEQSLILAHSLNKSSVDELGFCSRRTRGGGLSDSTGLASGLTRQSTISSNCKMDGSTVVRP